MQLIVLLASSFLFIKPISFLFCFRTPGDELLQKKLKKKKKKRKGKLPKPYESGVLPDPNPDRWLPKHERPGYRKKRVDRRFRDAGIGKGTQGAATGASDM